MATAELALAMPALVMVLAVALFAFGVAVDELRCVDAARAGARAAARGETSTEISAVAQQMAPPASHVQVVVGRDTVTVRVTAPARFSPVLSSTMHLEGAATAAREDDEPP